MSDRQIKFRGKRADGKGWVIGSLIQLTDKTEIVKEEAYEVSLHTTFQVEAESVGQFTGRKDSSGIEIYESDIVEGDFSYASQGVVIWDEKRCGFYIQPTDGLGKAAYDKYYKMNANKLKIVGNIFERGAE